MKHNLKKTGFLLAPAACLAGLLLLFTSARAEENKFMFWEISSGASTVYLLGSIHMAKNDIYPMPAHIEAAFRESAALAVEADISSASDGGQEMAGLYQEIMYQDSTTIKNHISEKAYGKLKETCDSLNIPLLMFQKMKPSFLQVALQGFVIMKEGYTPQYGVDMYFLGKADSLDKEILELESLEFQLELLDSDSDTAESIFIYMLNELAAMPKMIDTLYEAWKSGDEAKLEYLTFQRPYESADVKEEDIKESLDKLLINRNYGMADKISEYLKSGNKYFVVVGAGHLVGDEGIVELLRKKGEYQIQRR